MLWIDELVIFSALLVHAIQLVSFEFLCSFCCLSYEVISILLVIFPVTAEPPSRDVRVIRPDLFR